MTDQLTAPYPDTIWGLLDARASLSPAVVALYDEADRELTFGELRDRVERVAAGLCALGVGAGSRVTWQLPTRIETVVLSLALARLGAVQNPILPLYRAREVGFVIAQTRAEFFFVPGVWNGFDFVAMATQIAQETGVTPQVVVSDDALPEGDPATLPAPPAHGDDVRWIYFTSGTTSAPKGVRHTDGSLLAGGLGLADALGMTEDDIGSIAFPYAHIGGPDYLINMLFGGFGAVLVEVFEINRAVAVLARKGATMAGGGPAICQLYLNKQRTQPGVPIIPTLRLLSGGGGPKPPELYTAVVAEMGVPLCHGYGMTESPMIAQGGPTDTPAQLMHTEGRPVTGAAVRIVAPDGSVLGPGLDGEVWVKGPMVFKGYTDPALNADCFDDDGWFRTGDLGHVDADGYVVLTGRLKDVIIRKGENISAKEIEDLLYEHPQVGDVTVIGLPDPERGERVCAVVATAPGAEPLSFEEMVRYLKSRELMIQKVPEQLEVIDVLPRNSTIGKVLKTELRDRFRDSFASRNRP